MRLNLILPKVEPKAFEYPKKCPRKGCPGMRAIYLPEPEALGEFALENDADPVDQPR